MTDMRIYGLSRFVALAVVTLVLIAVLWGCTPAVRSPAPFEVQVKDALVPLASDLQVQKAMLDGRKRALQDPTIGPQFLQQELEESRLVFNDVTLGPQVLDLQADMMARAASAPGPDRKLAAAAVTALQQALRDPNLRPQLVAALVDLMQDPAVQAEMQKACLSVLPVAPDTTQKPPGGR